MFANGKVVVPFPGTNRHITLNVRTSSGIIDVHETTVANDGSRAYETLFTISTSGLERLAESYHPRFTQLLLSCVRPLRLGWMVRRGIVPVLGLSVETDAEFAAVTVKRKDKVTIDPGLLAARASIPEQIDELQSLQHGDAFTLFDGRRAHLRRIGTGYRIAPKPNEGRFVWIPDRAIRRMIPQLREELAEALLKFGKLHKPWPWF